MQEDVAARPSIIAVVVGVGTVLLLIGMGLMAVFN